jgi:glycosyltransferase involved in cell wall biosynthesis
VGKLRLAVFNTQPPHLYFGGVERRIMETAKRLSSNIDITVYSGTKAGFKKPTKINGLTVVPFFSTDELFPVDNWFFNRTVADSATNIEADVYEAHNASGYAFLKALRKRSSKAPFVETVHGVLADEYIQTQRNGKLSPREKLANLLMWRLSRLEGESARAASLVVSVSDYSAERASQLYDLDRAKVRVVPNGVDTERFKPADDGDAFKRQLGIGGRQVVLFVGRLISRKGLHFLVEAASRVVKECSDVMFVIVGDGPLRGSLTAQLTSLGLAGNFLFLGDVKEDLLPRLYNCCDVFAFPSVQEGQGIALLEAQASTKPVVAFNVGGVNEAVREGKSGLLVESANVDDLADAIVKLLSDSSLRRRMGITGREFVLANYTWDICAEKMLQVYREVLGS